MQLYLQVCDIIHDSPAFNRMPLSVDEVIVDLRETEREVVLKDKESRRTVNTVSNTDRINRHNRESTIKAKYKHNMLQKRQWSALW